MTNLFAKKDLINNFNKHCNNQLSLTQKDKLKNDILNLLQNMKSENEELSTLFKYIHNRSERDENKDSDIQNLYHFLKNAYFDFLMLKRDFSHVFLNLGIKSSDVIINLFEDYISKCINIYDNVININPYKQYDFFNIIKMTDKTTDTNKSPQEIQNNTLKLQQTVDSLLNIRYDNLLANERRSFEDALIFASYARESLTLTKITETIIPEQINIIIYKYLAYCYKLFNKPKTGGRKKSRARGKQQRGKSRSKSRAKSRSKSRGKSRKSKKH